MEITEILGKEEFYKELSSEKPVIVDFKATWCAPCKMQTEVLKDFATTVGDKVKILKIDVDENSEIAEQYKIDAVPTLLLFNNGQVEEKSVGLTSESMLSKMVIKYL